MIGRPLLADPEWSHKVREGRLDDIRPCLGCLEGCMGRGGKYLSCTVNPTVGMERELTIEPAERKKIVLVIGGGPGGMEAARVAALRGHKVTLWEKGKALGGNLIPASVPGFKQDYRRLIDYLSTQLKKLGVTIELGKKATVERIRKMAPDVVFLATGSIPIIPEIPGIEKEKVGIAGDVLLGKKKVGKSVVVVGGGLVGCETALYLAQKGKKVTIVEILGGIARDMFAINRMHLIKLLIDSGVRILMETTVSEITDDGVVVIDKDGKRSKLENDSVVLALGLKADRKLADALGDTVSETRVIGDCVEPRKVMDAVWEGFRFARLV
jgi:2-enoate reductase